MRITSAGNVGIGTTSPTSKLQINGLLQAEGINSLYIGTLTVGSSTGWYRAMEWTGSSRGGSVICLSTTGGSFGPVTYVIKAYKTFGNFYYHNGRFDDAIANYNEVIKRIPDDWGVYSNFASAYYMKGDLQSAAEIWLKLAEENEDPTMFANIGSMYFYLRRFEDAVGMYVKAAELTSNVPEYWGNQGEAYRQIPDGWNKAKAAYNKAIALAEEQFLINPNNYDLMTQTAVFYSGLGNFDKAFDLLAKVHAAGNVDYYYYYQAALVYVRAGNPVKAEDALMRAVEMGYPVNLLAVDAGLDPLQGRLRFESLVDESRR